MAPGAVLAGTLGLAAIAVLALGLALRVPLATTAVALMIFGVLHNVLEIRYIGGRYTAAFTQTLVGLLVALATGILFARLIGAAFGGGWSLRVEIVLTYLIVGVAASRGLQRYPVAFVIAVLVLVVSLGTSLALPAYHVVVITHLHNLIPLAFVWEFSTAMPAGARRVFRSIQVGWVLIVPGVLLTGVFDAWMSDDGANATQLFDGSPAVIAAGVMPPGLDGTTIGVRFLSVFAFMQLMHFVVWVWFLPRYAPSTTEAFERKVPWLTGRRVWAIGLGSGVGLLLLFLVDYSQGRTLYSALATYHAYLELPVLLAMLIGVGGATRAATGRAG